MRNQLAMVNNLYRLYFKVMQDIDMSTYPEFIPIPNFSGQLDGQNFTISNLTTTSTTTANKGLFANSLTGSVMATAFKNCTLKLMVMPAVSNCV